MAQLPKILGHPGYQSINDGYNSRYASKHEELIDKSLQIVYMTPKDTKISKSINIFEPRDAVGDFISYLDANGVSAGEGFAEGHLKVACHNITPLSETYNNEYGQSELFGGLQQIGNGALGELAQITGFKGRESINKAAADESNEFLQGLAKAAKGVLDWGEDISSKIVGSENAKTLMNGLSNPAKKIDIPQMWKGNSFNAQYEITVRLQCFNANDDNSYLNNVVAPLIAFMQFVCPRTETDNFYVWPFLMEFEIPGLVKLPMAYCSNLSVIKGGDVNDLSWIYRPNVIDCRMTINTVWGVTTSSKQNTDKYRPTVRKEFDVLSDKKSDSLRSGGGSGGSSTGGSSTGRSSGRTESRSESSESAARALT